MSDPRTHYQVSFTAKQAMALFVGLLFALGLAYFFGLMTGLSGRDADAPAEGAPRDAVAGLPPPASPPGAVAGGAPGGELAFPVPVTAEPSSGGPTPAPRTVQLFEDGSSDSPPARATAATRVAKEGGFRIQVVSVSSRADADGVAARLARQGFPARVEPGSGPKGTVYRVRVGPFSTREEAARAVDRLAAAGRREAWIVPPGQ